MYEKYFNKLREECLIRNRSSRTADTYINNIRHFMKWTGYKPMEDLSLQDARLFILEKRNSGLSSATCNFYNSSICFLYKHVLHIPWDQDIVPRMRLDVKLPKVLSLEEIEKLINSVQFTMPSGLHSVLERPFSEANGRPFLVKRSPLIVC